MTKRPIRSMHASHILWWRHKAWNEVELEWTPELLIVNYFSTSISWGRYVKVLVIMFGHILFLTNLRRKEGRLVRQTLNLFPSPPPMQRQERGWVTPILKQDQPRWMQLPSNQYWLWSMKRLAPSPHNQRGRAGVRRRKKRCRGETKKNVQNRKTTK